MFVDVSVEVVVNVGVCCCWCLRAVVVRCVLLLVFVVVVVGRCLGLASWLRVAVLLQQFVVVGFACRRYLMRLWFVVLLLIAFICCS